MIFHTKATQKNTGQKLNDHYLLNELGSDLDESSQAAVSGGISSLTSENITLTSKSSSVAMSGELVIKKNLVIDG
ncbi:hypothetical protein NDA07_06940 [Microcoleus vaginatus DQ-U2]|uniref:hypothetical protein n=1 Tax=Microcoleus vaginatus TaxID=119532 RepID=UPI001685A0F4|nr:hypothetical protein [Microcoleus sp. FACHB-DQ6]